jgi:uncharacterized protein YwqG
MNLKEHFIPLSLANFVTEILASERDFIKIIPTISHEELPIRKSKFLGIPYWPQKEEEYPKDFTGQPMRMLAQINFDEVYKNITKNDYLPGIGILQFFIPQHASRNQHWGLCFDDMSNNFHNISVIYHEKTDLPHYLSDQLIEINNLENTSDFPIFKHCNLKFESDTQFCPLVDDYSSKHFYGDIIQNFSEKEQEDFQEAVELNSTGCKIDGYAYFTQADPRTQDYDIDDPLILLLQIDSVYDENGDLVSMWGDSGVANWFIKKSDLINKDFSKVIYNWDCC